MPQPDDPFSAAAASPRQPNARRGVGCAGAFFGIVLVLALLIGFILYRMEMVSARGGAKLEQLVRDAFVVVAGVQPRITVNEHTVFEQNAPVLELAVVERDMIVERETSATWLASTKHMRLRAVYHIKAGFDLKQPFTVRVDDNGGRTVKAELPPAKILSVEQVRFEALDLDHGLWNRIRPEEIADEVNTLSVDARLKALQAGMPREAAKILAEQLRQKLGPDYKLEITTSTGASVPLADTPHP